MRKTNTWKQITKINVNNPPFRFGIICAIFGIHRWEMENWRNCEMSTSKPFKNCLHDNQHSTFIAEQW